MHMRRLTMLTNVFRRKLKIMVTLVPYILFTITLPKFIKSLSVTPAMQAGLLKRVMSLEDIASLVTIEEPKKRFLQKNEKMINNHKTRKMRLQYLITIIIMAAFILPETVSAQNNSNYIRIAKLTIDSTKLESYKVALKEHAEAAVRLEVGVLMLYAVYEKEYPSHVAVFEIYANVDAYNFHIKTPHFLKYKAAVQDMVKSLELIDVVPIALEAKTKISN